ncbi:hypothetical protein ABPG72_004647 [Tetrahymena utriculariae]
MAQLNQETQNQLQQFNSIIKLLELKDKDKLGIQSLPKEKKLSILQLREKIQVKNDFINYGKNSEEITEYFIQKMELNAQFEDIIALYEWVSYQIKYNQKLEHLEQSGGVDAIIFALMQYGSLKHDSAKKLFLLHILKILAVDYKDVFEDSTIFLDKLIQSDLVHSFPEMLTPDQNEINSLLLILMDQISWYSEEALKFILDGFEALQQKNNYPNKFTPLTIVLSKSKSSIFTQNICSFLNSLCQAFQNHFKNIQIIDDFQNSGLLDLLTVQAVNSIQQGHFIIDDCYFIREDYYGVSGEEIFFVADFERREFNCNKFFYKKDQNEGDFQNQIITLFIQIHQLQDKSVNRMRERETQYQNELQTIQQKKVQYNTVIKEEQEEEYVEKVKGSQKQAQLEERFKSEIQMREKEKIEQNNGQDSEQKKGFGRQNGIGKEKSEEKNQLWQTQQKIQALEKEIERLNQKLKQQDSQEQISQNILKQQFLQGQLLENQKLEEKDKIISKYKQENIQLLTKVSELQQAKQSTLEQLSLSKQHSQLQNQINQQIQKNEELSEKIKQLNEDLSSVTFKYEDYKQQKEKEISQLNLTLSAIKAKHSVSEENKNNILEQNQLMNMRLSKMDSASKQFESNPNNHSKESIIKLLESQFLQEISDLKEQNQQLQSQINKFKLNQNSQNNNQPPVPQPPQIPVAPLLNSQDNSLLAVPQPPNLGVPQAPNLGIPSAPQIPGIPQAPQLPGIPQAPQLPGIPQAPQLPGIPQAPQLPGIPQAPQITGVPQAPQLFGIPQAPLIPGIPQAPQIPGIPQAPQLPGIPQPPQLPGIPQAPQIPGIPQAPQIPGIPQAPLIPGIPQAPQIPGVPLAPQIGNFGAPPAPQILGIGIPPVPQLGIPSVPSLPGFGPPAAPSLNIPGAPIVMAPILPGLMVAPQPQQGVKLKKNPGIPMKGVNWQTLKFQDIQGTIWEKIKDENVSLEEDYLKQTFSQKATLQKAQNTSQQNQEQQAAKKITFLALERQQSVLLLLGKIKLKGEQIAEMLINCDPSRLTQNLITSLLASLPNEQEMTMVQSYDGKIENLGDAEKYFKALEKVNGYEERLQALKFKNIYPETKEFLTSKTALIAQFLDSLLSDQRIIIILENALALGNYMNGTGFKGGAWGFKFSNIDKMVEVKSMDGKVNLLMYLISNIEKKEGKEIVKVDEDLKILDECTKTPINQLISEIADLKRGVKTLEKSIKVQTSNGQDKIKEQIEPFYVQVQPEIAEIEQQVKDLEAKYKTVAEYFCEDPRKLPSDEFAKQVLIFKKSCITAKIQNKNLKR